jgi:hypothetical protein
MKNSETVMLLTTAGKNLRCRLPVPLPLLALVLALSCGCTTHSHYRDDGAKITVKKFVGIPYLKKEERTVIRQEGSGSRPVQ